MNIGEKCPTFNAKIVSENNGTFAEETITLPDYAQGKFFVLFFYPRDNTPGCTTESCDFRDNLNAFNSTDCVVIGISRDNISSHKRFIEKHSLNFPIIADPEETICNLFSVMKEKNMYGKKVKGIERSTFLFDKKGMLIKEWRGVKITGHIAEVLQAIK